MRCCPLLAPVVVINTIGAPSNGPPTTPALARWSCSKMVQAARSALAEAAAAVDAGEATGAAGSLLAKRVRGVVARAAEDTLVRAGHALGPAPLALDAAHAKRVADLQLYVRQHHAARDENSLGRAVAAGGVAPW